MHAIRLGVRENRLSDRMAVTESSYEPYVAARSAWVAELDSAIAGFAILDRSDGNVWALFVAPGSEGRGVGRALHEAMLQWAQQERLGKLWLSTARGTRAEQFYAQAGWERVGVTASGEVRFEREIAG